MSDPLWCTWDTWVPTNALRHNIIPGAVASLRSTAALAFAFALALALALALCCCCSSTPLRCALVLCCFARASLRFAVLLCCFAVLAASLLSSRFVCCAASSLRPAVALRQLSLSSAAARQASRAAS